MTGIDRKNRNFSFSARKEPHENAATRGKLTQLQRCGQRGMFQIQKLFFSYDRGRTQLRIWHQWPRRGPTRTLNPRLWH